MATDLPQTQGKTLPDAWDYKGRPAERSKSGGWTSAAMILGPATDLASYIAIAFLIFNLFNMYVSIIFLV